MSSPIVAQNLPTVKSLEQQLADEISKFDVNNDGVLDHLRTTYIWGPDFRYDANRITTGIQAGAYVQQFDDLFHNPADTIYTLAIAYPYLSATQQTRVRTYMQYVYTTYPPYQYDHMGTAGAPREINDIPPNEYQHRPSPSPAPALTYNSYGLISAPTALTGFQGWTFNPFNYYALAKYAELFNNASDILARLTQYNHAQPPALPTDMILLQRSPHIVNSYIAGYYGYQRLRELAGLPVDATNTQRLQSAMQTRVSIFPATENDARNLPSFEAGGFLWLVPELGDYLYRNANSQVDLSVNTWKKATAYYMIPNVEEATRMRIDVYNEGSHAHMYDESSLFLAQAYAQKKSRSELEALLHGPGLYRGDLFFIQNLVAAIKADPNGATPVPTPAKPGDANGDNMVDGVDYMVWRNHYNQSFSGPTYGDFNNSGFVDGVDYLTWRNNYGK